MKFKIKYDYHTHGGAVIRGKEIIINKCSDETHAESKLNAYLKLKKGGFKYSVVHEIEDVTDENESFDDLTGDNDILNKFKDIFGM